MLVNDAFLEATKNKSNFENSSKKVISIRDYDEYIQEGVGRLFSLNKKITNQ